MQIKLDYHISSLEDRKRIVQDICGKAEHLSSAQKKLLADYLLFLGDAKQTTKERNHEYPIVTENRKKTTNKRESSFEEIASTLQNGEDGIYGLINEDRIQLMDPRERITKEDIENIPGIKEQLEIVDRLEEQFQREVGANKYKIKKQIIETYKDIYVIKESFKNISAKPKLNSQIQAIARMPLPEVVTLDKNNNIHVDGVSLMDPECVTLLLTHYVKFKAASHEDFTSDMKYLLLDLEALVEKTLRDEPLLMDLLEMRVEGYTGEEIQQEMERTYGVWHSQQYYSTLWTQKIPKMLSDQAKKDYLLWYYTYKEPMGGHWKICGKCGKELLAHPLFFSPNSSSDGYYSICKSCRSRKSGDK